MLESHFLFNVFVKINKIRKKELKKEEEKKKKKKSKAQSLRHTCNLCFECIHVQRVK